MPRVACSRCFAIFESESQAAAPLCPRCAALQPPAEPLEIEPLPEPPVRRGRGRAAPVLAVLAVLAAAAAAAAVVAGVVPGLRQRHPAPAIREPDPIAEQAAEWRAQGIAPAGGDAAALAAAGREALAADRPERTAEAHLAFVRALERRLVPKGWGGPGRIPMEKRFPRD